MEYHEVIAANIRGWRGRRNIPLTELADAIGVYQPNLSSRLKGDVDFRINELSLLARKLEVPLSTLLEGLDEVDDIPAPKRRKPKALAE